MKNPWVELKMQNKYWKKILASLTARNAVVQVAPATTEDGRLKSRRSNDRRNRGVLTGQYEDAERGVVPPPHILLFGLIGSQLDFVSLSVEDQRVCDSDEQDDVHTD